jgi:DUF438 domain-containing protein
LNPKDYRAHQWVDEFPAAITVCAKDGTIVEMNARSEQTFAKDGGKKLLGGDVLACHPPAAREMLEGMLASGRKNVYTIEKDGVKKLICQSPWYQDGEYMGFVELSLEIPKEMRHFKRK